MHGRPRKPLKPEEAAALSTKAQKLRSLQSEFLENHKNKIYTKEALELNAKLLEINPECYTAWNYRKLAVDHLLSQSESDPDSVESVLDAELKVAESALRQNFKSYGAWHHRKWVLSKGVLSIDRELCLLQRFQQADSRNFHAWNYRRFVAALMKRSKEDELNYTEEMIGINFSNYSAWHNRSVILSYLLKGNTQKAEVLNEEYERVHQAIFTDPDDQSGWFYHLWLLDQTVKSDAPLLVSSWPFHGSSVTLRGNRSPGVYGLSALPLILYFNQAVEGVNSSSITVESEFGINEDLIWKPLSTKNSKISRVWFTDLNFPCEKFHSVQACLVKVILGHCNGIVTSNGSLYTHHSQLSFKVSLPACVAEPADWQDGKMMSWKDEDFQRYETQFEQIDPVLSLGQLTIKDDVVPITSNWHVETTANEINLFRDLLSLCNCKIGKLTLARLLTGQDSLLFPSGNGNVHSEVLELYNDLMQMDPTHTEYYRDERSLVLLQQMTSSQESLLRHCYCHRDMTKSVVVGSVCLRLNNLSLSRVGSLEKLLWVQILDLSHNALRSVEGLEALQLLSCLNLSCNKLGSFTALAPLRMLRSLKVLNISHNEIGLHSIDTTRYLCSSPFSHTEEIDWCQDEVLTNVPSSNYWEAFMVLKGMNLIQLDIMGNSVADEKFWSFLYQMLPSIKWLDGRQFP